MTNRLSLWLRQKAPFLFEDKVPLWFTIIASLGAAIGAYYIAPAINRQFQLDEARSAHISKTTVGLNDEIILLSQKVRRLNDGLVNNRPTVPELRQDCLDLITKLQWMLVDLRVVLKSPEDLEAIKELGTSIDAVKTTLDRSVDARAQPELLAAMRDLGEHTQDVLDRLYVKAALKKAPKDK